MAIDRLAAETMKRNKDQYRAASEQSWGSMPHLIQCQMARDNDTSDCAAAAAAIIDADTHLDKLAAATIVCNDTHDNDIIVRDGDNDTVGSVGNGSGAIRVVHP